MSFLLAEGRKVTEVPFRALFPEIASLADQKDYATLLLVRLKIHQEFLADAGDDEVKVKRLNGIQWRLEVEYGRLDDDDEVRTSFLQANMWNGAEVVRSPTQPGLGSF